MCELIISSSELVEMPSYLDHSVIFDGDTGPASNRIHDDKSISQVHIISLEERFSRVICIEIHMKTVTSSIVASEDEPITKDRRLQLDQKTPVLSWGM